MDVLSKWRIKPYIDLYKWEMYHKCEFPLTNHEDLFILMDYNRHSVHLKLDDNYYELEYVLSRKDFDEVMYCAMDAPPMVEYPKPYFHDKRIRTRWDVKYSDWNIREYEGYIWDAEFIEGLEGRYGEYCPAYKLSSDGGGCVLSVDLVNECFEVVE